MNMSVLFKNFMDNKLFGERTYGVASEQKRTLCLFSVVLKILKKTGVYSSSLLEARVRSPNGPSPPCTFAPLIPQILLARFSTGNFSHLLSYNSALSKLENVNVTSTSACIYVKIF